MNRALTLQHLTVLFFLILTSCFSDNDVAIPIPNKNQPDTTFAPPSFDTIKQHHDLNMYNEKYTLNICLFSSNDSAVINPVYVSQSGSKIRDTVMHVTHNQKAIIHLKKGTETVLNTTIDKGVFSDSLSDEALSYQFLYQVKYNGVRTNRLYFSARIGIPETDIGYEALFAIFYRSEKLGQLDTWGITPLTYE